ncbi:MAG: YceI family protein [Chloroflexi bacterium]|nr:YceI family protein [Chloroflexota bacterium]
MHRRIVRFSISLLITGALFLAGCAPVQSTTPPAPVPTAAASPAVAATSMPVTGLTSTPAGSANPVASPTGSSFSGTAITYSVVAGQTTALYRVREQLANVAFPTDAIGKTQQVSGSITISSTGAIVPAQSKIVVNLTNLQSDQAMRDNYVSRAVLQTDQYPEAVFNPTQITGLTWPLPQTGKVSFQLTGNLTIRNVTKPVTWTVTGNVQGNQATGVATTTFTFEDFSLTRPQVPVVLSVQDHITLELDLTLEKS